MKEIIELYKAFRKELDDLCVPTIVSQTEMKVEKIVEDGNVVGILCSYEAYFGPYIDCIYIKPEYRRRGFATKAVLDFVKKAGGSGVRVAIINNNKSASEFWNNIFNLMRVDGNAVDTLYEIVKIKDGINQKINRSEIKKGAILQSYGQSGMEKR